MTSIDFTSRLGVDRFLLLTRHMWVITATMGHPKRFDCGSDWISFCWSCSKWYCCWWFSLANAADADLGLESLFFDLSFEDFLLDLSFWGYMKFLTRLARSSCVKSGDLLQHSTHEPLPSFGPMDHNLYL